MSRSLTAVVLSLFAAACGTSISTTPVNAPPRPMGARHPATVEVFTSGAPARPHVDVALIEAEETSSFSTHRTPDMIGKLREQGAAMGCDGIVVGGMSSRDPGITDAETWLYRPRGRKGIYATCIVYAYEPRTASAPQNPYGSE